MGTTSGPPDHPGYKVLQLTGNVTADTDLLNQWASQGFRVVATYETNLVILSWGYDQQGRQ